MIWQGIVVLIGLWFILSDRNTDGGEDDMLF